jgi:hypothetical protein
VKMTRAIILAAAAATVLGIIRDKFLAGFSRDETYSALRPLVASQTEPFVFKQNVGGSRLPKPMDAQYQMLRDQIGRIYSALENDPGNGNDPIPATIDPVPDPDPVETENERPVKKQRESDTDKAEHFYREFLRLREFTIRRSQTEPLDSLSYRPLKAANKLIQAGFPVDGLLSQMCLTWPDDAKQSASVPTFDMGRFSAEVMASRGISEIVRSDGSIETPHKLFGAGLMFWESRVPMFLIGPHGTGKSFMAQQLADHVGQRYGETPMSNGASRGDLLGRHTIGGLSESTAAAAILESLTAIHAARLAHDPAAEIPADLSEAFSSAARIVKSGAGGFVTSEYESSFEHGGFFCLEELDAADAGMLLVINNALESKTLFNSINGRVVKKHANHYPLATGNTPGLGATRDYNTRERLDASTLDRWRMGRLFVGPDPAVERSILFAGLSA